MDELGSALYCCNLVLDLGILFGRERVNVRPDHVWQEKRLPQDLCRYNTATDPCRPTAKKDGPGQAAKALEFIHRRMLHVSMCMSGIRVLAQSNVCGLEALHTNGVGAPRQALEP